MHRCSARSFGLPDESTRPLAEAHRIECPRAAHSSSQDLSGHSRRSHVELAKVLPNKSKVSRYKCYFHVIRPGNRGRHDHVPEHYEDCLGTW